MNKEAMDSLLEGIKYLIEQAIQKAPYDKVKSGRIIEINDDGTYKVLIEDNLYNAPALRNLSLSAGSIVKIMIPQNEYSNMFILG